ALARTPRAGARRARRPAPRRGPPPLGIEMGFRLDVPAPCRPHIGDAGLEQIADYLLDIAPDIADLGEFGCLDLDEGSVCQPRQPPCDLGLADTGRADHQDVLRHHLFAQAGFELLASPPVAESDGDGALGLALSDDVAIELRDNFARREVAHSVVPVSRLSTPSLSLVRTQISAAMAIARRAIVSASKVLSASARAAASA